jgi:hypothetical protein
MCVTGNKYVDLALGVALVAVTAGAAAPTVGAVAAGTATASTAGTFGAFLSSTVGGSLVAGSAGAAALGAGTIALGGQLLLGALTPKTPDYGYTPAAQQVQYNSQNIATTGSGGRQATASLAEAIKRSKKRKLTQEDVGDLSIDTGSFANTGLQLA